MHLHTHALMQVFVLFGCVMIQLLMRGVALAIFFQSIHEVRARLNYLVGVAITRISVWVAGIRVLVLIMHVLEPLMITDRIFQISFAKSRYAHPDPRLRCTQMLAQGFEKDQQQFYQRYGHQCAFVLIIICGSHDVCFWNVYFRSSGLEFILIRVSVAS